MQYTKAFIPYGRYYSTPFVRWNGSIKHENSVTLGAATARRWFVENDIDPTVLDYLYYGITTAQPGSFFGHPYTSAVILDRKKEVPALQINQVCLTSATALSLAAGDIEMGAYNAAFVLGTDRISSTPLIICPDPVTGAFSMENIVLDNFKRDPSPGAGIQMYQTADAVAREAGITRQECDEVTAMRYQQYGDALKNDRAFQKKYMFPIESRIKKKTFTVAEDEGVIPTTLDTLRPLKPLDEGGVITYGSQTHPADGNAGIFVTNRDTAQALSKDKSVTVQVLAYDIIRAPGGRMAGAPAIAMEKMLRETGVDAGQLKHVKTHNPFIVNDINISKRLGIPHERMNNYGSSLVYGHPQAPTAARAIIELIEALTADGGGLGAFAGCAAGDLGGAMLIRVS